MLINRMFFLSFLFTSGLYLPTAANTADNNCVNAWKTSYVDHMLPQELQMTANIILNLYAMSIVEEKIRQFFTPITRLNQVIRTKIDAYENPAKELEILKTLLERLGFVTSTRIIYNQTLSSCCTHYNQNTVQIIDTALTSLQLYAQEKLRTWANEKSPETAQKLTKSSQIVTESIQHFQGVSRLHQGMGMGQMPIKIAPEDEENKSLFALSIILKNNPELFTVLENVTLALNETSDHAAHIIHAGAEIYKEFYIVLYNKLVALPCDEHYKTTLFSMYGLLPEDYQSVLPHPDHVFEHMLQTTKLYTQTEYSPS